MQKVVRSKSYVFEGDVPQEVSELLKKWGTLVKKGEVYLYAVDMGEIKVRKIADEPTKTIRRIYIMPDCGCVLELDETRNFENGVVTYSIFKKRLCPTHQV